MTHFADHAAYTAQTPDKVVQYAYDFGNRWVRKVLDADGDGTAESNTIFVYDGNQITLQFDDATPADPASPTDLTHRYLYQKRAACPFPSHGRLTGTSMSWG